MYFITQGMVEVYNNDNDEFLKNKPFLFLPKSSYFGDYQILYNLKSNLVFKTKAYKKIVGEESNEITFMCISADDLLELCDLFP